MLSKDSSSCLILSKPNVSSKFFVDWLLLLLSCKFSGSSGKVKSEKTSLAKFGVNDYNTSSYHPKPFRATSQLNHASEHCVLVFVIEAVGSCAHWKLI